MSSKKSHSFFKGFVRSKKIREQIKDSSTSPRSKYRDEFSPRKGELKNYSQTRKFFKEILDHEKIIDEMKRWIASKRQYRFYRRGDPEWHPPTEVERVKEGKEGDQYNYNSPLWEFQDVFIEHKQPLDDYSEFKDLYLAMMHLGDIFRGLAGNIKMDLAYPDEKFGKYWQFQYGWGWTRYPKSINYQVAVFGKDLLKEYREKLLLLIKFTQEFPLKKLIPIMEGRKKIQLESLNTMLKITDWLIAFDPEWHKTHNIKDDEVYNITEEFSKVYYPKLINQYALEEYYPLIIPSIDNLSKKSTGVSWEEAEVKEILKSMDNLFHIKHLGGSYDYKVQSSELDANQLTLIISPNIQDRERFEGWYKNKDGMDLFTNFFKFLNQDKGWKINITKGKYSMELPNGRWIHIKII